MQEEKNTQPIDLSGAMRNYKKPSFQNENYGDYYATRDSGMVKFLIKFSGGLIKNKNQANIFLLAVFVIMTIASLFLFFVDNGQTVRPLPIPQGFDS